MADEPAMVKTTDKRGLGRGLESLIPPRSESGSTGFAMIRVEAIDPNPNQPRTHFDDDALRSLAASIEEVGILQPLIVRPRGGRYELVAGERRWRAAQHIGLVEVPAMVRAEEQAWSSLTEALVENIQREDLGALEEAAAYRQLLEDFGWTHEELAYRVGKARPTITNALRLLGLPAAIQGLLERGEISQAHAKVLAGVEDRAYAEHIARRAAEEGWSVRMIEEAARSRDSVAPVVAARKVSDRPAEIIAYEERLNEILGSRVNILYSGSKGSIKVRFGSLEELDSIFQRIGGASSAASEAHHGGD